MPQFLGYMLIVDESVIQLFWSNNCKVRLSIKSQTISNSYYFYQFVKWSIIGDALGMHSRDV